MNLTNSVKGLLSKILYLYSIGNKGSLFMLCMTHETIRELLDLLLLLILILNSKLKGKVLKRKRKKKKYYHSLHLPAVDIIQ